MRRAFHIVAAVIVLLAATHHAAALEVTCIEASRYRHLYQLFGGDPKQLAAFLELDPARLPHPDHCRAVLVSGRVESPKLNDADKLLAAIEANQGWLAVLQLSSGGGVVQTGYRLGFLTRMFWLKTQTVSALGRNLNYTPDFFVPPAAIGPDAADELPDDRIRNWRRYLASQRSLSPLTLDYVGCASSCGLVQTAGVDRAGDVRVHRARVGGASQGEFINLKASMSDTDRRLLRLELEQIAFYRQMDPGPDFVRHYQETSAQTTTPVEVSRFPRYVADYLTGRCKVNGDQLQELDRQIGATITELMAPQFGYWIKTDNLRRSLRQLRSLRAEAERCIAAAHERERRAHFAKLCPNGCDRRRVMGELEDRVRALAKQMQ